MLQFILVFDELNVNNRTNLKKHTRELFSIEVFNYKNLNSSIKTCFDGGIWLSFLFFYLAVCLVLDIGILLPFRASIKGSALMCLMLVLWKFLRTY